MESINNIADEEQKVIEVQETEAPKKPNKRQLALEKIMNQVQAAPQTEEQIKKCNDEIDASCPICMVLMLQPVKVNECGHSFCAKCLLQYRQLKDECPICRVKILTEPKEDGVQKKQIAQDYKKQLDRLQKAGKAP